MYQHRLLISELEDAVRRGSQEKRAETLKRVTDLFLGGHERLTELQIQVFDDVLGLLIARMESKALIELSGGSRQLTMLRPKSFTRLRATMR
jgi:hypothetical protein